MVNSSNKTRIVKQFGIFLGLIILFSCQNPPQSSPEKPPVKIIFDTDMGSDCDDVGALALLHTYADMGKAEILGCMYSSGKVPYGAAIIQAINIYRGRPNIPVGAYHKEDIGDEIDKMSAEKLAQDTAAFGHSIIHNFDAPEQTSLTRKLLAEQPDSSVIYITVGHTKGLYDLLVSTADEFSDLSGKDLIKTKVKQWIALGALNANNEEKDYKKDWNFFFNGTATYTQYLVQNFPSPIYFISAGSNVMTGKSLKNTPSGNIIRTAYRDWLWWYEKRTLDDQRPSWDLVAVYFAVEGNGEFLTSEKAGFLEFDAEKGCVWRFDEASQNQSFIIQKPETDHSFSDYLNEMIVKGM